MENSIHKYWPVHYSKKAIIFSLIIILSFIIVLPPLTIPILPLLIFGFIQIVLFFTLLYRYIVIWNNIPEKLFYKHLFIHSFFIRIVFILYILFITSYVNIQYPFINPDEATYHFLGSLISHKILNFQFESILSYFYNKDDWGFNIFVGIIYTIFGNNQIILRIANVLLGTVTTVYISQIAGKLFSFKHAKLTGIITMLIPSLLWFNATLLKESLMIFFIVIIFYHSIKIVVARKFNLKSMFLITIFTTVLLYFRIFLSLLILSILLFYFTLNFINNIGTYKKYIFVTILILLSGYTYLAINLNFDKIIKNYYAMSIDKFDNELDLSSKQVGISYKKALVVPFIITGSIITPFPSFLYLEKRQLELIDHFQNEIIRNILYILFFIGMIRSFKINFKESSIILLFIISYIGILVYAGVSFQDRFMLPTLPFIIIIMSVGLIEGQMLFAKKWNIYLFFIFIAIWSWNLFKLSLRT